MKKRKLLFALLMFLSAACASNTLITETVNSDNSTHWWTSWLKSPTCAPPCWENITPGITTKEEAAAILVNMQTIEITYQGEFGVEWVSVKDNTEAGWVNTAQTNIVNAIVLGISSKTSLTIETVIASFGNPSYVQPYACREEMCSTVLVYPESGMLLDVFLKDDGNVYNYHQVKIQPDTKITGILFFPAGLENYKRMPEYQEYDLLMEWKGYVSYPQ